MTRAPAPGRVPLLSRRQLLAFGAVGSALVATGCPAPSAVAPPEVTGPPPIRLRYGSGPDQFGDLYLPMRNDPRPVVGLIHGGLWGSQFGLDLMAPLAYALVSHGVAVWNVEYRRLGGAGGWPATFLDVASALDHLKVRAREFTLDLQHVAVVGHSAGGQLALWAGGRSRIPETSPLYVRWPRPVRGVVALAPLPDLRRAHAAGFEVVGRLLGGTPTAVPERYAAGSPADLLPLEVPQVLIHGRDDRVVPVRLSEEYAAAAKAKGDPIQLFVPKGVGHFEPVDPRSTVWPTLHRAVFAMLG
jgi:acetyl esterase/lipase